MDRLERKETIGSMTPPRMDTLHLMGMVTHKGIWYILTPNTTDRPANRAKDDFDEESEDESDNSD